jgi:exosome complex RNA-binding protein Rrp42 (RNase PH superfamily)
LATGFFWAGAGDANKASATVAAANTPVICKNRTTIGNPFNRARADGAAPQ